MSIPTKSVVSVTIATLGALSWWSLSRLVAVTGSDEYAARCAMASLPTHGAGRSAAASPRADAPVEHRRSEPVGSFAGDEAAYADRTPVSA